MNKKRQRWLKAQFEKKHGRPPGKTEIFKDGSQQCSEWWLVKRHYQKTGAIL